MLFQVPCFSEGVMKCVLFSNKAIKHRGLFFFSFLKLESECCSPGWVHAGTQTLRLFLPYLRDDKAFLSALEETTKERQRKNEFHCISFLVALCGPSTGICPHYSPPSSCVTTTIEKTFTKTSTLPWRNHSRTSSRLSNYKKRQDCDWGGTAKCKYPFSLA